MKNTDIISAILLLYIAKISTQGVIRPTKHDYFQHCNDSTTCNLFTAWEGDNPVYCPCIANTKKSYCTGGPLPPQGMEIFSFWNRTAIFCTDDVSIYFEKEPIDDDEFETYTCQCSEINYVFQCNGYSVVLSQV